MSVKFTRELIFTLFRREEIGYVFMSLTLNIEYLPLYSMKNLLLA